MRYLMKSCLLLTVAVSFAGCNSLKEGPPKWKPFARLGHKAEAEDQFGEPVRMAVIWKDATLQTPGKPTTRGFGGRVYLYDAKNQPVKAEGELIVYGYDNTEEDTKPNADRKYVIRESEFQNHLSDTGIGPSYSIWIPWDQVGGEQKTVAMIPVFKTSNGSILKGGQAITMLPGRKPKNQKSIDETTRPYRVLGHSPAVTDGSVADPNSKVVYSSSPNGEGRVETASYEKYPPVNTSRIKTETISVNPSLAEKINSLPQQDLKQVLDQYRRRPVPNSGKQVDQNTTAASEPTENAKSDAANGPALTGRGKAWWNDNPFDDERRAKNNRSQPTLPVFGQPGTFR